jgi:hypothetical protein
MILAIPDLPDSGSALALIAMAVFVLFFVARSMK